MDFKHAQAWNLEIADKIKALQSELVHKMRVRVIERLSDGKREVLIDESTDYIKAADTQTLYNDYRALYTDDKKFFILVEPIEDIKRSVSVRLPVRSDAERQPSSGLSDPTPKEMGAE